MTGQRKPYDSTGGKGPYFIADIPVVKIDYRGLTAYARQQGKRACDLSDEEKNRFIKDGDMELVRKVAIKW